MASLSVIVLTYNRIRKLQACLDRLLPQLGAGDEVLLIDSGSTDGTREHYGSWRHPVVRLIPFDGQGSWAESRNFGVEAAKGALIAFLDDDCLPAPDWVARGRTALAQCDAVGGMVRPIGIDHWPVWWHPEMAWMVGLSVPGHLTEDAGRVYYPFTANLWVRAAVCREVPFQEIGGWLAGGETLGGELAAVARYASGREDAQWWRRLRTTGYRTRFDPLLTVGHAIDPTRLDLPYLRGRAEQDGLAWARREGHRRDLPSLAYQWWRQLFMALGAPAAEPGARASHWHLHQLLRRRHGRALIGLSVAFAPGGNRFPRLAAWPWLASAGGKLLYDQSRTLARNVLRPWLRSEPADSSSTPVERLAVFAFGYLGDLVILQSVLRGLMQAHPETGVYVLTPSSGLSVLRGIKRLNPTALPDLKPDSRAAATWLTDWMTKIDPDAVVAPYLHEPWGRALMAIRRPPRPIIGFDSDAGLTRMRHLERLALRVHKDLRLHEARNLARLFEVAGLSCQPEPAAIDVPAAQRDHVRDHPFLAKFADHKEGAPPLIMLNPDAGQPFKEWTDESWADLIRLILRQTDWRLVVNESRPRLGVEAQFGSTAGRLLWLRSIPLDQLIAWLAECSALVTVDAGPQHLAHGLGIPSLTLYGRMDERRWTDLWERPIHRTVRACASDLTPEELQGLAVNHELTLIRPEVVFESLRDLMRHVEANQGA